MTDLKQLDDTWNPREYPVLREAARLLEQADLGAGVPFHAIASATGLDLEQVHRAAVALRDDGLVELRLVMPSTRGRVVAISGEGRRLAANGQPPRPPSTA